MIDLQAFTPLPSLAGGILIGASAAILFLGLGRIAGISGIIGGLLQPQTTDRGWRIAFALGLLAAPLLWHLLAGNLPVSSLQVTGKSGWGLIVLAGLLVGIGTRLGNGCTSGHGICGLSRLSLRSLVAVCTFMGAGMVTVFVIRHVIGG